MMTTTVDVSEAQEQLAQLLALARAGGKVIIAEGDTPVARLTTIVAELQPRVMGLHEGQGWVSDDFDDLLPDEFWLRDKPSSLDTAS